MKQSTIKLLLGVATCSVLLSACATDGISFSGGSGSGITGGGGSSNGGSGGGGSGNGGGSGGDTGGQAGLGDGSITVTANGTTVSTIPLTTGNGTVGSLTSTVVSTADNLIASGNAALPLQPVAGAIAPATSSLPLSATIADTQLSGGTGTQPIGIGILSDNSVSGSIASVNLGSAGKTASITVLGNGVSSIPGSGTVTDPANTAVAAVMGATSGLLNGTSSLANATVQQNTLVNGDNPLIGASLASPNQSQGSLLTVGAQSANKPLTLKVGDISLLPTSSN